jgi:hypothetical protein
MADEKRCAPVTGRDLYPALGSVYLLLCFALLGQVRGEGGPLRDTGYLILAGVAGASSVVYNVLALREFLRRTKCGHGEATLPDATPDPVMGQHDGEYQERPGNPFLVAVLIAGGLLAAAGGLAGFLFIRPPEPKFRTKTPFANLTTTPVARPRAESQCPDNLGAQGGAAARSPRGGCVRVPSAL